MPEFVKKDNGETDWSKIFMGAAIAAVYIMQQFHAMQVSNLREVVVPRSEYTMHQNKVMDKDVILDALDRLEERLDTLEKP